MCNKIDRLTDTQKNFLFVENLEREINNGGFNQFFWNSSGNFTHETLKALKIINANIPANIVEKAISHWPKNIVPNNRSKRQNVLAEIEDQANVIWEECDKDFYKVTKTINLSLGGAKIPTDSFLENDQAFDLILVLGVDVLDHPVDHFPRHKRSVNRPD